MRRLYIISITLLLGGLLATAAFFFWPVPAAVKPLIEGSDVQRCFYSNGIGYYSTVYLGDFGTDALYDDHGEEVASCSGIIFSDTEQAICRSMHCFPIFGK